MLDEVSVKTHQREELLDITSVVREFVNKHTLTDGVITLFVPHTTAAVTINENADPTVKRDIIDKLKREFPQQDGYHHMEGNSDAHIKSSLTGPSLQVIVSGGSLVLGTWQSIYFCEYDGPRNRRLYLKAISG